MYGAVMLIAALRESVIVIAPMPTSHFLAWKAAPEVTCAHSMLTTSCSSPRSLASRSSRSTSNPTTLVPSLYWNGLYGRWVQIVSLPGFTKVMPAAAALSSLPPLPESSLPQAERASASAATVAVAAAKRRLRRVGTMFIAKTPRHWL